jgi:hypothetical protein
MSWLQRIRKKRRESTLDKNVGRHLGLTAQITITSSIHGYTTAEIKKIVLTF